MTAIHEKIVAQLEQRKLKKRDLARALEVSPQTATDICKGRSAITLPHLRNLVRYFGLRADFWLDDQKLLPDAADKVVAPTGAEPVARPGLGQLADATRFLQRMRGLVAEHRREFVARNPDLTDIERSILGLSDTPNGSLVRVGS